MARLASINHKYLGTSLALISLFTLTLPSPARASSRNPVRKDAGPRLVFGGHAAVRLLFGSRYGLGPAIDGAWKSQIAGWGRVCKKPKAYEVDSPPSPVTEISCG